MLSMIFIRLRKLCSTMQPIEFKPHEYQKYAIEKIIEQPKYNLFLEMGLGKTVSTLTAINHLIYDEMSIERVLIIAPKRVAEDTWAREIYKWAHTQHLTLSKVLGTEKQRRQGLNRDADIYVTNRENSQWLVDYYSGRRQWPFDMVVIDELSSFKNPQSQRFKALKKVSPLFKRFVGLTGTPAPNSLMDLWGQMYFVDGGERLGKTFGIFKQQFFYAAARDPKNAHVVFKYGLQDGAEDEIFKRISDVSVSMKSVDYLEMPERIDNKVMVKMTGKARAKYEELEREKILEFEDQDVAVIAKNAAALTQKLLQYSNGAAYDDSQGVQYFHDEKIKALEEIVEEANGQPILVFYSFKHDAERIKKKFKDVKTLDDEDAIYHWNNGDIPLLIAHPASAGHGLNLQDGGHIIVWFGLTWSLENYLQANARLHRQGQENTTIIHHIMAEDTHDERVYDVLQGKDEGQNALLNAIKARMEDLHAENET